MLEKLQRNSIVDQVFDSLKSEILLGTYKPGDKLPSENELCKSLGVSRASVKMALQKLCTLGFTDAHVGDGTYVKHFELKDFFNQIKDFLGKDSSYQELINLRTHLELTYLILATKKITNEEIINLQIILIKMTEAIKEHDYEKVSEMDYEFHLNICKATKNQEIIKVFLEYAGFTYASVFFSNMEKNSKRKFSDDFIISIHHEILDALQTRDINKCVAVYEKIFSVSTPDYLPS